MVWVLKAVGVYEAPKHHCALKEPLCCTVWEIKLFVKYVGHFKSSAKCACAASRMMQSFWFSRQTSGKKNVCVLAGYVVPVLQNGAFKWKKKLTGVRSRAVTSDHTIRRGLMHQVQYRKFWKSMDGKCFPTHCTVLTWGHQPLTCSQNWRNHSLGNASEALRRFSNEVTVVIGRINNEGVLTGIQDLFKRWTAVIKVQWRLHCRTVNVFCEIN